MQSQEITDKREENDVLLKVTGHDLETISTEIAIACALHEKRYSTESLQPLVAANYFSTKSVELPCRRRLSFLTRVARKGFLPAPPGNARRGADTTQQKMFQESDS